MIALPQNELHFDSFVQMFILLTLFGARVFSSCKWSKISPFSGGEFRYCERQPEISLILNHWTLNKHLCKEHRILDGNMDRNIRIFKHSQTSSNLIGSCKYTYLAHIGLCNTTKWKKCNRRPYHSLFSMFYRYMNLNTRVRRAVRTYVIEHIKCNESGTKGRLHMHVRFVWNEIGQIQWKTNGFDNVINGVCNGSSHSTNGNGSALSIDVRMRKRVRSLSYVFVGVWIDCVQFFPSCSSNYIECLAFSYVCTIFLCVTTRTTCFFHHMQTH